MTGFGFSADQWRRAREDYTAWWNGDLGRPLASLVLDARPGEESPSSFLTNWPQNWTDDEFVECVVGKLSRERYYGDALPCFFMNFGPGVAAAFAGAGLRPAPDTVWFEPIPGASISGLHIRLDPENVWWRRVRHVTELLAERIGERVQVSLTDIGGNLDILASLRGTHELLADVLEQPEEVDRCRREITRMWLETYDALHAVIRRHCPGMVPWAAIWAPESCYMLQCDFSAMISPAMFERFVVPDIEDCCARLKHSFYHLDGPAAGRAHLQRLCAIESLRGIQWIPGSGAPAPEQWPEVLQAIRDAGKLCQVFTTAQGALDIVRRHGGKGFLFCIRAAGQTDASARRFLADLRNA